MVQSNDDAGHGMLRREVRGADGRHIADGRPLREFESEEKNTVDCGWVEAPPVHETLTQGALYRPSYTFRLAVSTRVKSRTDAGEAAAAQAG